MLVACEHAEDDIIRQLTEDPSRPPTMRGCGPCHEQAVRDAAPFLRHVNAHPAPDPD